MRILSRGRKGPGECGVELLLRRQPHTLNPRAGLLCGRRLVRAAGVIRVEVVEVGRDSPHPRWRPEFLVRFYAVAYSQ